MYNYIYINHNISVVYIQYLFIYIYVMCVCMRVYSWNSQPEIDHQLQFGRLKKHLQYILVEVVSNERSTGVWQAAGHWVPEPLISHWWIPRLYHCRLFGTVYCSICKSLICDDVKSPPFTGGFWDGVFVLHHSSTLADSLGRGFLQHRVFLQNYDHKIT